MPPDASLPAGAPRPLPNSALSAFLHGIEARISGGCHVAKDVVTEKNVLRPYSGEFGRRFVNLRIGFHCADLKAQGKDGEGVGQDPIVRRHQPLPLKVASVRENTHSMAGDFQRAEDGD